LSIENIIIFDRKNKKENLVPTYGIFQAARMHNLKGSQFLLRFLTAERNAVSNAARNIPSPLPPILKMKKHLFYILILTFSGCNTITNQKESLKIETQKDSIVIDSVIEQCEKIELIDFKYSTCQENCNMTSRIIKSEYRNDTLTVKLGIHLICSGKIGGDFTIKNDTIDFKTVDIPSKSGAIIKMDCHCFYHLTYKLKGISKLPKYVLFNGKSFEENQLDSGYEDISQEEK